MSATREVFQMDIRLTGCDLQTGWIKGTVGRFRFEAKVFDEGSQWGINGGRVSKLGIWDEAIRKATSSYFAACIANYDREWDIEPKTEEARMALERVLQFCERGSALSNGISH